MDSVVAGLAVAAVFLLAAMPDAAQAPVYRAPFPAYWIN